MILTDRTAKAQRGKPQPKTNWPQRNTRITKRINNVSSYLCVPCVLLWQNLVKKAKLFRIALQISRIGNQPLLIRAICAIGGRIPLVAAACAKCSALSSISVLNPVRQARFTCDSPPVRRGACFFRLSNPHNESNLQIMRLIKVCFWLINGGLLQKNGGPVEIILHFFSSFSVVSCFFPLQPVALQRQPPIQPLQKNRAEKPMEGFRSVP